MLKLLKHDIKDTYLEIVVLNGILLGVSFLIFLAVKLYSETFLAVSTIAFALTLSAAFYVVLFSVVKNFHTKLFTDCGYLTLTTPISLDKILLSKIIVNMLWITTSAISLVVATIVIISSFTSKALPNFLSSFAQNPLATFKAITVGLTYALSTITMLAFVLVLSNTGRMKKHKLLKGILIFIGISFVTSLVYPQQTNVLLMGVAVRGGYAICIALNLFWSVLFYFLSRLIITRKLELE